MVKHTQTICRQIADELFECDHFVGLTLKGLTGTATYYTNLFMDNFEQNWVITFGIVSFHGLVFANEKKFWQKLQSNAKSFLFS